MDVMAYELKEKPHPCRVVREKGELSLAQALVTTVLEGVDEVEKYIGGVYMLEKYVDCGARPMKIRFRSQIEVIGIMTLGSWKELNKLRTFGYENNTDMNECKEVKKLLHEARKKRFEDRG